MLREEAAGTYRISTYFLARTIVDMLVQIPQAVLYSVIVYYMIGYQPDASKLMIFMCALILDGMAALSLATMVACLCITVELSTVVLSFVFELNRLS